MIGQNTSKIGKRQSKDSVFKLHQSKKESQSFNHLNKNCRLVNLIYPRYINLGHDPFCLRQGYNYFLVMLNVGIGEGVSFTILEPLLGRLVATDKKVPGRLWKIAKVLLFVDKYTAIFIDHFLDKIRSGYGIGGDELIYLW